MPQTLPPAPPSPPEALAEKIRSGEFFRESMLEYHRNYHDIIAERYIYLGVTALSLLIFILSFVAINLFFPLNTQVPFIYSTHDIVEDLPIIKPIGSPGDDVNVAIQRHLLSAYVEARESYVVDRLDFNAAVVRAKSTPEVFAQFSELLDPRNPQSPIARFQRRATRSIVVQSIAMRKTGQERTADVRFEATVTEGVSIRKEQLFVNITFRFEDIAVDQDTGNASPLKFVVSAYQLQKNP